jgi:hypothetical protein
MIRRLSRRLFQQYRSKAAATAKGDRDRFAPESRRDYRRPGRQLRAKSDLFALRKTAAQFAIAR